ncbi:unnamed protein product [Adineta ricciae]|uniref:Uncharacterized protein n=1 Tax=Adineta ricciae TaxID=249248 RepID=A0A815RZ41_ADIRI|nr:unnamed protein product [Adineta ricciae]CAF1484957.1 unnamed protein product [Adineta ricciae]
MAPNHRLFAVSCITLLLILIISKCHASYPLFGEIPVPQRPAKFATKNDVDRYVNRMKQYYETMKHLRYWRRAIDQSDEEYDDSLEGIFLEYEQK